ncbi:ANR family transcriptional regulator [Salmonella enterica]|nr:ANR family transcriptional regulator [Salmonella enterica]
MDNQHTDDMMAVLPSLSPSSWGASATRAAEAERRQEWKLAMQLWALAQGLPRHPANQQWAEARTQFCARQWRWQAQGQHI